MQRFGLVLALLLPACFGTTGGDRFSFDAYASGPPGANGDSYVFRGGRGDFEVTLTRARLRVGAVYLNRSVETSVASDTSCTLAGIYVAQVTDGLDVDLLSPERQAFPIPGDGTADLAHTGEVWLVDGDVNAPDSSSVILDVAGSAEKDGAVYPFTGELSIGSNRREPPHPGLPGSSPICKERVVSGIDVHVVPERGGSLVLGIDPAGMFTNVDFSTLAANDDGTFVFDDESQTQASRNLYDGLHHGAGVYDFSWEP